MAQYEKFNVQILKIEPFTQILFKFQNGAHFLNPYFKLNNLKKKNLFNYLKNYQRYAHLKIPLHAKP